MKFPQPVYSIRQVSRLLWIGAGAILGALLLVFLVSPLLDGGEGRSASASALVESVPTATPAAPSPHGEPVQAPNSNMQGAQCMVCHSLPNFTGTLLDSSRISLTVNSKAMKYSVHSRVGSCATCHKGYNGYPHMNSKSNTCAECHFDPTADMTITVDVHAENQRAMTVVLNERCSACHQRVHKESSEGAHAQILNNGNLSAPQCSDCHGSHNIQRATLTMESQACASCHEANYGSLMSSVHGVEGKQHLAVDAPTCADCHGSHTITGPGDPDFRKNSVAKCLECHQNQAMMARYGLPSDSFDTSIDHYHAGAIGVYSQDADISGSTPVCYDCHDAHSIRHATDESSPISVNNLRVTCQKCHANSGDLSVSGQAHFGASSTANEAVHAVQGIFRFLIPGSFVLLLIYILLDANKRSEERSLGPVQIHE